MKRDSLSPSPFPDALLIHVSFTEHRILEGSAWSPYLFRMDQKCTERPMWLHNVEKESGETEGRHYGRAVPHFHRNQKKGGQDPLQTALLSARRHIGSEGQSTLSQHWPFSALWNCSGLHIALPIPASRAEGSHKHREDELGDGAGPCPRWPPNLAQCAECNKNSISIALREMKCSKHAPRPFLFDLVKENCSSTHISNIKCVMCFFTPNNFPVLCRYQ